MLLFFGGPWAVPTKTGQRGISTAFPRVNLMTKKPDLRKPQNSLEYQKSLPVDEQDAAVWLAWIAYRTQQVKTGRRRTAQAEEEVAVLERLYAEKNGL